MSKDLNEIIEQLSDSLGIAVDKVYPYLYKQAMIDLGWNIFWIVFFAIGITLFVKAVMFVSKKQKEGGSYEWDWDEGRQAALLFGGGAFTFIGILFIGFSLYDATTIIFNTEYYMVKDALGILQKDS